jgi:hypothetical protein
MSFFNRIANGWSLAKASLKVLRLDPELMLFPLASAVACLVVVASFALPLFGMGGDYLDVITDDKVTGGDILAYVLLFLFYFVNYFVIIFFNSALVACAIIRFKGGDPTVMDGIKAATSAIHYIALWALVAATVGLILKIVESRSENVGRIVAGLLGAAWSMLTFFVVPILVVEHQKPWEAFKRSKNIMFKSWGETLASSFSLGLFNLIVFLVAAVPIVAGVMLVSSVGALGYALIAVGILLVIAGVLCVSALDSILLAGLYIYAEEGVVPEGFDQEKFNSAFQ